MQVSQAHELDSATTSSSKSFHGLPPGRCMGALPRLHVKDIRPGDLDPQRPAVILGAMADWDVGGWNLDHFRTNFADKSVKVVGLENGLARFLDFADMRMGEFFERMADPAAKERLYMSLTPIEGNDMGTPVFPELSSQIRRPAFIEPKLITSAHLWIAYDESRSNLHFDARDNIMAMVSGRKRFVLFPDDQTSNLYPVSGRDQHCARSRANFANLDFDKYPKLAKARYWEDTIGPGEMLYLPYNVWHYFWSEAKSIAVNHWCRPPLSVLRRIATQPRTHGHLLVHNLSVMLRLQKKTAELD